MNFLEVVRKNFKTITLGVCAFCLVVCLLPYYKVSLMGYSESVSAFGMIFGDTILAALLLVAPVGGIVYATIGKNHDDKQQALINAIICVVGLVFVLVTKGIVGSAVSGDIGFNVGSMLKYGFGAILSMLAFIAGAAANVLAFLKA